MTLIAGGRARRPLGAERRVAGEGRPRDAEAAAPRRSRRPPVAAATEAAR
jgi:hypothetical protein